MGSSDHDTSGGVEMTDTKGDKGSGDNLSKEMDRDVVGGKDSSSTMSEALGTMTGIIADHNATATEEVTSQGVEEVEQQTLGRLGHHQLIHSHRTCSHLSSQSGCPE